MRSHSKNSHIHTVFCSHHDIVYCNENRAYTGINSKAGVSIMIVVTDKSEKRLVNLIGSIRGKSAGLRMVHLQLSEFPGDRPKTQNLANIINDIVINSDASAIFCDDGDVFIIASGITAHIFEKLTLHIATFLSVSSDSLPIKLYDLNKDYSVAAILCENKLNEKLKSEEGKSSNSTAVKTEKPVLNIDIEDELIKAFKNSRSNRSKPEIMVVEDDMFSRKLVTGSLSKEYNVRGAKDGHEAVKFYALHGPDVMFLDIELPDVTGHEVLKKILSFDPDAYIVMLSGKGDKENVLNAISQGAKGFVGKPFTKEKLLQYINQCPTVKSYA